MFSQTPFGKKTAFEAYEMDVSLPQFLKWGKHHEVFFRPIENCADAGSCT